MHGESAVKQVIKLVVMKNKQTGESYSFIMAVIPELDYMLRKGDELDKINYLSRNSDLNGYMFFYTLDGGFINGRLYKDGKIVGGTDLSASGKATKAIKAMDMAVTYTWDQAVGGYVDGVYNDYGTVTHTETFYITVYVDDGTGLPSSPPNTPPTNNGGGSGDTSQGRNKPPKLPLKPLPLDDQPDKRTDCTEQAAANAKKADDAMKLNTSVNATMDILRNYAATKSIEYGSLIDTHGITNFTEGVYGNVPGLNINTNTMFDVHTHHNPGTGKSIYMGPSIADVHKTLHQNNAVNSPNYRGSIIFGYDGEEYLVYIEDKQKAKNFMNGRFSGYMDASDNSTKWLEFDTAHDIFDDFRKSLLYQGYSDNDAYIYGLSHYLNVYFDTGIKLYIKQDRNSLFKELKTEKIPEPGTKGYNVKPSICP